MFLSGHILLRPTRAWLMLANPLCLRHTGAVLVKICRLEIIKTGVGQKIDWLPYTDNSADAVDRLLISLDGRIHSRHGHEDSSMSFKMRMRMMPQGGHKIIIWIKCAFLLTQTVLSSPPPIKATSLFHDWQQTFTRQLCWTWIIGAQAWTTARAPRALSREFTLWLTLGTMYHSFWRSIIMYKELKLKYDTRSTMGFSWDIPCPYSILGATGIPVTCTGKPSIYMQDPAD